MLPNELGVDFVMERAIQVIEDRGWCQGEPGFDINAPTPHPERTAAVCLVGAVYSACHPKGEAWLRGRSERNFEFLTNHVCPRIQAAIVALYPQEDVTHWKAVSEWNDRPDRTKAEVIALLKHAASIAVPFDVGDRVRGRGPRALAELVENDEGVICATDDIIVEVRWKGAGIQWMWANEVEKIA